MEEIGDIKESCFCIFGGKKDREGSEDVCVIF